MKRSPYRCACCGRQLRYDKRIVLDAKTQREKEVSYGRWVTSSHTGLRYCWPDQPCTSKGASRRPRSGQLERSHHDGHTRQSA
jgi:hypothetical protein